MSNHAFAAGLLWVAALMYAVTGVHHLLQNDTGTGVLWLVSAVIFVVAGLVVHTRPRRLARNQRHDPEE